MFDQMVDAAAVEAREEVRVEVPGDDLEELFYDLLSELLYEFDVRSMVFSDFSVRFTEEGLTCTAKGEALDLSKHNPKAEIKAVTYHMLSVDPEAKTVTVIFDV